MSSATTPVGPSCTPRVAAQNAEQSVTWTAFYLESEQQWLFAWLHVDNGPPANHGVIICPPVGHEQIHSHRSLRHLADALARAHLPCLRLDYHGTGDSGGSEEDLGLLRAWTSNIRDAIAWMRRRLGCRHISLIGLRLGATLAALADEEVDGLVLWAPVVKGRSWVREMRALSLTSARNDNANEVEAAGFLLTEETALDVSAVDLMQCRPRCRRALILTRDDSTKDSGLVEYLASLGIAAEQSVQPGYSDMMAEPHHTKVPHEAIARAVEWLARGDLSGDLSSLGLRDVDYPTLAPMSCTRPAAIRERIWRISQQPDLFGIISEPNDSVPGPLPAVVVLNAGSAYRVGPNRLHVSLARQLAAHGFLCVRMDLCGLGDSVSPDPGRENDPYPATAFRDIDLVLKRLHEQFGVERVVLMGLCSGAYAAFQSAARLANPVLASAVAINPLTFYWREGMSLDVSPAHRLQAFDGCLASAFRPRKWLSLLFGRGKTGILGVVRRLAAGWRLSTRLRSCPASVPDAPDDSWSHPLEEDLPGDLDRITRAGRRLSCFFARSDPGYRLLMFSAKRKVEELCRSGALSVHFIDDADHTFSRREKRLTLGRMIAEHLCRLYQGAAQDNL